MSLRARTSLSLLLLLAAACGGKTAVDTDAGGGDSGPGPIGADCPSGEPSVGASCGKPSLECEYGGDPRTTCNDVWTCSAGRWDTTYSKGDPSCPSGNAAACPGSVAAVNVGSACDDPSLTCDYSTSAGSQWCACTFMGGPIMVDAGNQYTWQCSFPSMAGCPAARPRLGTACTQSDLECDYSICGIPSGLSVRCESSTGTWVTGFGSVCAGAD